VLFAVTGRKSERVRRAGRAKGVVGKRSTMRRHRDGGWVRGGVRSLAEVVAVGGFVAVMWLGATAAEDRPARDVGSDLPVLAAIIAQDWRALDAATAGPNGINAPDQYGVTPLIHAVRCQDVRAVRHVLSRGADVNWEHPMFGSPLLVAQYTSDPELARVLIEHGADVRHVGANGRYPFLAAANVGSVPCMKVLLAAGAEPMPAGALQNPLCVGDDVDTLRFLLALGLDPNATGRDGVRPLVFAAASHASESVRILLSAGADPRLADRSGRTARDAARGVPDVEAALKGALVVSRGR
jgi:ankyrin repeat protein